MYTAQSEVRKEFMTQMKVTEEGISKLGYLHWVVAETLRRQRTIAAPSTRLPTSGLWSFPTPAKLFEFPLVQFMSYATNQHFGFHFYGINYGAMTLHF